MDIGIEKAVACGLGGKSTEEGMMPALSAMFYPETFLKNKPGLLFLKTLIVSGVALTAFAANSVVCRLALGEKTIDTSSFSVIHLLSGAVVLWAILKITRYKNSSPAKGSWRAS